MPSNKAGSTTSGGTTSGGTTSGGTTTGGTTTLNPDSSYTSWGVDVRWQIPGRRGHTLNSSLRSDSNTGGSSNAFSRLQFQTGMDFRLTSILGCTVTYNFTDYKNSTTSTNNYTAHLINAGLGLRF